MKRTIHSMVSYLTSGQPIRHYRLKFTGVKHYFPSLTFFLENFQIIGPTATNLTSLCFSCWDNSSDTQFCQKRLKLKISALPNLRQEVRSGQSWPYCIYFNSEWQDKHWHHLHLSIAFYSKVLRRRVISHVVMMGWVKNWPYLRSLKWKSWNKHSACSNFNITS